MIRRRDPSAAHPRRHRPKRHGRTAPKRARRPSPSPSGCAAAARCGRSDSLAPVPAGEKRRAVYDAGRGTKLPGRLVRREGDPDSSDVAVDEAYDGAGATYDLYFQVYGRNSIDGRGMEIDSSVHYGVRYDNAFWDGAQMVYGDGDGELFERFTIAVDVIGHELTHGVTDAEAALEYHDQPGALNESFSDVFGSLVKQRERRQTAAEADWIIGEGLFTSRVRGVGPPVAPGAGHGVRRSGSRERSPARAHGAVRHVPGRRRRRPRQLGNPESRLLSGRRLDRGLRVGEGGPDLVRRARPSGCGRHPTSRPPPARRKPWPESCLGRTAPSRRRCAAPGSRSGSDVARPACLRPPAAAKCTDRRQLRGGNHG